MYHRLSGPGVQPNHTRMLFLEGKECQMTTERRPRCSVQPKHPCGGAWRWAETRLGGLWGTACGTSEHGAATGDVGVQGCPEPACPEALGDGFDSGLEGRVWQHQRLQPDALTGSASWGSRADLPGVRLMS